ncbi:MAG TPA: gluconate 2-dehydrogenase subunit 3 family protein [Myxococcota bacterium]|nr:gluconate 2-dehydrogenase subunit 3 family protein [Myxococcota bacterium]
MQPDSARRGVSRRLFLVALAGLASLLAVGTLIRSRWIDLRALEDGIKDSPRLRRWLAIDLDASSGVGDLSAEQIAALRALAAVLVPSRYAENEEALSASSDFARELSRDVPGYRLEFERAVALLDARSRSRYGREFASLGLNERRELVDDVVGGMVRSGPVGRGLRYVLSDGRDVWRLFRFAARGLMVGFYASALGWRLVGYPNPPGDCVGLAEFQQPAQLPVGS